MEEAKELLASVWRKWCRIKFLSKGIDDLEVDDLLIIMDKYSMRNKGFRYLLNIIDIPTIYLDWTAKK